MTSIYDALKNAILELAPHYAGSTVPDEFDPEPLVNQLLSTEAMVAWASALANERDKTESTKATIDPEWAQRIEREEDSRLRLAAVGAASNSHGIFDVSTARQVYNFLKGE